MAQNSKKRNKTISAAAIILRTNGFVTFFVCVMCATEKFWSHGRAGVQALV